MQIEFFKIFGGIFEKNKIHKEFENLSELITKEDFWKDNTQAKKIIKKKNFYEELINNFDKNKIELENIKDLHSLSTEENDQAVLNECESKIKKLLKNLKFNETKCFLSGESDSLNIYLEIHAGAGGTESQDWANMLRRMYLKWSDKKKI